MPSVPTASQRAGSPESAADPAVCLAASLRCAVPASASLLLGVSGGSDSMALLAATAELAPQRVQVVHVRHHLRPEAEDDARLVRECCAARGIPCLLADAGPSAADPSRTETAARARRLAALRAAAERTGARWILLAHHRDDDLETLVLRLQRGHTGDRALAGIPTLRPLGGGVQLLRPFLLGPAPPGRADLARAREAAGWPHAEDASNADLRIARNRVRADLAHGQPVPPAALLALRNAARARLAARLARVTQTLSRDLRADGRGSSLALQALDPSGPAIAEDIAELLRLLGGCLLRARRIDPRAGVLRELAALVERRTGTLSLPAEPSALVVRASRTALHFPDEPLRDEGPGDAVALHALLRTSLYL